MYKNKYELRGNSEFFYENEYENEHNDEYSIESEDWHEDEKDNYDDNYLEENYDESENEEIFNTLNSNYKNKIKRRYNNNSLLNLIGELNVLTNEMPSNWTNDEKIMKKKKKLPKINLDKKYIEVGCLGFWKSSSSKNKFDLTNLKDNNVNTYWQSSSLAPHTITIHFIKLTKISKIYLLFNYLLDESYTPYEISIKIGNDENHLEFLYSTFCDIHKYSLNNPFWFIIDVKNITPLSYLYNYNTNFFKNNDFIYCRCLQIIILSSQHNGKDTRIRQIKIFGPNYSLYKYDKMLI
ncbi:hypothetical protein PGAL8A_00532200 [Plasmodium gallinaceum]|uniref:DOC domain-containing protein n=1 Tax=Plasmodium gallinaceum TaxID=5849 RepID=A0A1J1GZ74_PLAGA|nr:hypothetical protein PGAL8A_00532200 [Plasmodium gallinaceum]CRG97744.1 hypothetical protein PGAL8A_00532200 [Plasmodium gallinaceum]